MNELEQLQENSLKPAGTVFEYEGVKLMIENDDAECDCDACNDCYLEDDKACPVAGCYNTDKRRYVYYVEVK